MILDTLDALHAERANCPSDFTLDALLAECLPETEVGSVRAHLDGCNECAARLMVLDIDPPELNDAAVLAAMRRAAADPVGVGGRAKLLNLRWLGAFLAVGAAAVGLFFLIGQTDTNSQNSDGVLLPVTRAKGGLKLEVRRKRGGVVERLLSGGEVRADDSLRFVVSLPSRGRVAVLGIEAKGTLYTAWPLDQHTATVFDVGQGIELPGAVQLDGPAGEELLVVVLCPEAVPVKCSAVGALTLPECPEQCTLSSLRIRR